MIHSAETHLAPETLDALLIEPEAAELAGARAHRDRCAACHAAFLAVQGPVADFRLNARRAADHAMNRLPMRPPVLAPAPGFLGTLRRPAPLIGLWAGAAAAVTAVALLLAPHAGHRPAPTTAAQRAPQRSVPSPVTTTAAEDEALLTGIDSDLSRSVAGPLEPLSDPMPNRSNTGTAQN